MSSSASSLSSFSDARSDDPILVAGCLIYMNGKTLHITPTALYKKRGFKIENCLNYSTGSRRTDMKLIQNVLDDVITVDELKQMACAASI